MCKTILLLLLDKVTLLANQLARFNSPLTLYKREFLFLIFTSLSLSASLPEVFLFKLLPPQLFCELHLLACLLFSPQLFSLVSQFMSWSACCCCQSQQHKCFSLMLFHFCSPSPFFHRFKFSALSAIFRLSGYSSETVSDREMTAAAVVFLASLFRLFSFAAWVLSSSLSLTSAEKLEKPSVLLLPLKLVLGEL